MVTLLLDQTQLEVVLSPFERALARRRDSVRVERALIRKVQLTEDAWTWLRGVPSPGTIVRGTLAMGTWSSAGADDFVVVRRRQPAAIIDLDETCAFARLVLSTRHGLALVQALQLDGHEELAEVADIVAQGAPNEPRRRRGRVAKPLTA